MTVQHTIRTQFEHRIPAVQGQRVNKKIHKADRTNMGNAISATTQNYFHTSCMAKYTNITKPQVMAIRNLLVLLSQPPPPSSSVSNSKNSRPTSSSSISPETTTSTNEEPTIMIQRKHLKKAIQKVNLAKNPDQEVIDLIFTLWCQYDDSDSDEAQQENRDKNLGSEVVLPAQCKKASR